MRPKPKRTSSGSSVVSLDPTVVSHITSTKSTTSNHTRTGSTPVPSRNAPMLGYVKGHGRTNSAPSKHGHNRSNSLRRTKNSTEMLRQRSKKSVSEGKSPDLNNNPKRGRNFTVTNVGTGGMLYLRPSSYHKPLSPAMPPIPATPLTAPVTRPTATADHEATTPRPASQGLATVQRHGSRTRSVSPKRLFGKLAKSRAEQQQHVQRPTHSRSQSFSTLDESRKSIVSGWPKTLRVIINRGEPTKEADTEINTKPSLQIPIPHYRLGIPRFSVHGTPVLRNSGVSQASSGGSPHRNSAVRGDGHRSGPPPSSMRAFAKLQSMNAGVESSADEDPAQATVEMQKKARRWSQTSSIGYAPSLYDQLNDMYNDSTVVRFAHDVRDVTAATPARIIAQISSESFMDYELVSDFFLTFRSYMTPANVLDLLLARLAWAIGRMSDDGRIIRIRTFAALRHWILNYFMDDFVPDRNLRMRFCDEVNELYEQVRDEQIGGPSDLKILQDLKRCWNGRCSLYWDGDYFNMDSLQESELHPGGVIGSRNPDYAHVSEIDESESEDSFPLPNTAPIRDTADLTQQEEKVKSAPLPQQESTKQIRTKPSIMSTGPAESLVSEQSIQPHSCTILYKGHRTADDGHNRLRKPRPVTVLERRQRAPSDLKVTTSRTNSLVKQHKRGGSSFDSTRERTPFEAEPPTPLPWVDHHDASVIRGFAYAPVEPFVNIPAQLPHSPAGQLAIEPTSPSPHLDNNPDQHLHSPVVKNVFGSIRRALSGKHGSNEMAYITISGPLSNASLATKRSLIPLNISRSQEELRKRTLQPPLRTPVRIDLLCAAAIESYQASVPNTDVNAFPQAPLDASKDLTDLREFHNEVADDAPDIDRIRSHITSQSGSIVIVDGTGLGIPAMSGALAYPQSRVSRSSGVVPDTGELRPMSYETQIAFKDDSLEASPGQIHASSPNPQRQTTGPASEINIDVSEIGKALSSTASTTTVKNRQSLASSVTQARPQTSAGESASTVTQPLDDNASNHGDVGGKQSPQLLRRRPGGDLRKNQNVHDLDVHVSHHESLDSLVDTISSPAESLVIMKNAPPVQPYGIQKAVIRTKDGIQRVSLINTHSSQHLRPSFEAAIAGFSDIPDDNDGGLEATLLKLEGRYEKNSPDLNDTDPSLSADGQYSSSAIPITLISDPELSTSEQVVYRGYLRPMEAKDSTQHVDNSPKRAETKSPVLAQKSGNVGLARSGQHDSQASLPLLQRSSISLDKQDTPRLAQSKQAFVDTPPPSIKATPKPAAQATLDTVSANGAGLLGLRPETAHTERSFLLDEDDNYSDLSSEMSVDIINYSEAMGLTGSPILVAPGTAISGVEMPSHPLAHSSLVDLTMYQSPVLDGSYRPPNHPLTPQPSPITSRGKQPSGNDKNKITSNQKTTRRSIPFGPAHIPFILACDSQVLAQQLTLIEQSALTEVEWSDLVEMRWSIQPAKVLDWAEYITKADIKGVDLVITRFNLMVKWALSEIVLTQDIEERVRVITKLIHVAAHARRLHNYASMLQITIALTSTDCARLTKTWRQVPEPDKSLLKNMEALIQPVRNFNDLRVEMESADLSDGCIPFIGLYVHDLTYNAQKPAEIDAGRNRPPLINFERFRTAAIIVKGLLRLIDASSKYEFDPIHGIVERCLWIASLDDDRIRSLSRALELETTRI